VWARRHELTNLSRSLGGVLLAAGVVVALSREAGDGSARELGRVLIAGAPAVGLYMLAVGVGEERARITRDPWRAVVLVTALLLAPVGMFQFLRLVGADTSNGLWSAGVFAIVSVLATHSVRRARVPSAALLGGLSALLAWVFAWEQVFGEPSADTTRWLTVLAAALLLLAAAALARRGEIGASEIATAGGIAAVIAGSIGVFVGFFLGLFNGFVTGSGPSLGNVTAGHGAQLLPNPIGTGGQQSFGWNLYLLLVSLALIWLGARVRTRGLGYVGAGGLLVFVLSVSAQVTRLEHGRLPSDSLVGWPLALVIAGVVALALPALYRDGRGVVPPAEG
jgi:hypothetical protein